MSHPVSEPVPARRREAGKTALAAVLLVLLSAILFWPVLFGGKNLYFGDLGLYFIPLLSFQRDELLAGRIPLWNPFVLCGTPFVGNPQAWPLHPSSLLLYLMPAHHTVGVMGAASVVFAGVGTLLFLRRQGFGAAASLLGAVAFGFNGALVSKLQFPNMAQAASYLPWLLWAADGVLAAPRHPGRIALLGLLIGLALLAAHPQIFMMQFYLLAAWTLWRLWGREDRRERRAAFGAFGAALVLGMALSAGQILPVLDFLPSTVRSEMSLAGANRFHLPWADVISAFALPNASGNPALGEYTGFGNFWERAAYGGVVSFALALYMAFSAWQQKRGSIHPSVRFWSIAALVGVWLSLGIRGVLYIVAFFVLPGVSKFHDPARWLHVGTFALACLAAAGLQVLRDRWAVQNARVATLAAGAFIVLCAVDVIDFARTLNPAVDARVFASRPDALLSPGDRLYHADERQAWRRFVRYRTYGPEAGRTEHAQAFLHSLCPNLPMYYGLRQVAGYEPVKRRDMAYFVESLETQMDKAAEESGPSEMPLLSASGARAVVFLEPRPFPGEVARADVNASPEAYPAVLLLRDSRGRARLWSRWRTVETADEAWGDIADPLWDGTPVVAVPGSGNNGAEDGPAVSGGGAPLPVRDVSPQHIIIDLPEGNGGGLATLADTLHPGWQADVDGRPVPIRAVNAVFRGVNVPGGARRVEFRYEPGAWRAGLFVSLCAAGTLMGMAGSRAALLLFSRTASRPPRPHRQGATENDG